MGRAFSLLVRVSWVFSSSFEENILNRHGSFIGKKHKKI